MSAFLRLILASTIGLVLISNKQTNTEVKVYVFFGSASQDCGGYGICRLYLDDGDMDSIADASGVLRLLGDHLELNLDRVDMRKEVFQKYFTNPTFFLYESFLAPAEISRELNVNGLKIPLGEYEYDIEDDEVVIYMRAMVPDEK